MKEAGQGLSAATISAAVEATGLEPLKEGVAETFAAYFDLLEKWNARLNLTAIREPAEILRRHFLECIFAAQHLPPDVATLLDYGSGAGFPGIPIALCRPEIHVTLAESQGKKAGFLREAVRVLALQTEVYAGRVEEMHPGRSFDAVALRAVDRMQAAVLTAASRVTAAGCLVLMISSDTGGSDAISLPAGFSGSQKLIPHTTAGRLLIARREIVPRGT